MIASMLFASLQRVDFEELVHLIVDELGNILAIAVDAKTAQVVAIALSGHVETSHSVDWHVGEHLPIFHT